MISQGCCQIKLSTAGALCCLSISARSKATPAGLQWQNIVYLYIHIIFPFLLLGKVVVWDRPSETLKKIPRQRASLLGLFLASCTSGVLPPPRKYFLDFLLVAAKKATPGKKTALPEMVRSRNRPTRILRLDSAALEPFSSSL